MGEADPLVIGIIRGLVVYGIIILAAGAGFQFYRHEKRSAYALTGLTLFLSATLIAGFVLRG